MPVITSAFWLSQLQRPYAHKVEGSCPSPPSGGSFYVTTPVCLPTWHHTWKMPCSSWTDHCLTWRSLEALRIMFFDLSSACNTIQPTDFWGTSRSSWGGSSTPLLLATVCCCVCKTQLLGRPTGNSPGPFPVHLLPPITPQPSTKVL